MQKTQLTDVVLAKIGSRPALPKARLAGIVILALLVFAGMRFYGHLAIEIIANRHSSSTAPIRISLDGHHLLVPKNLISDKHQRRGGEFSELDLYMRWPALSGFSYEHSVDFNTLNNIVLVSVRASAALLEQSRYLLLTEPGEIGPSGLELRPFARGKGFGEEVLAVGHSRASDPDAAEYQETEPFVARCFRNEMAGALSAPCERHLPFVGNLVLVYRFPARLLKEWRVLDEKIGERAQGLLQDG